MAFPTSPTNGQQANINGITYTYSSTLTAWTVSTSVSNSFVSISASGNITGNYFFGNGSQLTGIAASGGASNARILGSSLTFGG